MKDKKVDKKITKQIRIDAGWHKILFQLRAELEMPITRLVEDALIKTYKLDESGKPYKIK